MDLAILGATGAVGSALVVHLLKGAVLGAGDRLILCGHHTISTERRLLPEQADLLDAFDETDVAIEIVDDCAQVAADIVVVAPGETIGPACPTRRDLALANRALFETIAARCAQRLPEAAFVVVSNPVELAVDILARATERHRVVGMGAEQDSLRFARAVAEMLGLTRREVRATVMGEHGAAMVPLWSTVEVLDRSPGMRARLAYLRQHCPAATLPERAARLRAEMTPLLAAERIADAYALTRAADPDARIFVDPFITLHCLHSTPHATANAACRIVAAMVADDGRRVAGQVRLDGEAYDVRGILGVPLAVGPTGWRLGALPILDEAETTAVRASAAAITATLAAGSA